MLIRSQDKKSLLNLDNVTDLSVVSGNEIIACYVTDEGYQRIGKYSDEAKAIKVLDMIQDNYNNLTAFKANYPNYGKCTGVFQMPADSEVQP